ncbi:unnamed protein product [Dovyalis caffra]|uniref:Uncharacterized protein n=1 Tax=Dovyalis caffra TaxID=77055 RepID=A0AAV1RIS4_9ROSI|nr:unnamed protein product [Dovyalis caffra]
MTTSVDEGQFLNMLLKLINAKNTMEIGVYTRLFSLATRPCYPRGWEVGGLIGYDNTLWNGSVVAPLDALMRKYVRYYGTLAQQGTCSLTPGLKFNSSLFVSMIQARPPVSSGGCGKGWIKILPCANTSTVDIYYYFIVDK